MPGENDPLAPGGGRRTTGGGFRWQPPSPEHMARLLPQYDQWEALGRGGMGAVYKARQINLDRIVAIKILPPDVMADDAEFAERFKNEARTMAKLMHPALVTVFDSGETAEGQLYFVMEYVDGTDLQQMIHAGGRLPQEQALAIAARVCDALEYAHKRGIIHRDIKPANILINQEGHVKVADFGLAKMLDTAATHGLTRSHMAMGTPDYASPEGLRPGKATDHRADLYAVGVMLYEMLTGELPRGMFKLPSQKKIGSDPRFDEIIHKAMEHELEERYQSATELRRDLDAIRATPKAREEGTGVLPQRPQTQEHAAPSSSAAKEASTMRMRMMWAGLLVSVPYFIGLLVWNAQKKPAGDVAKTPPPQTQSMPGPSAKPPENADALSEIKNWKDMTEVVREKARHTPGLVVESDAISRVPGGSSVRLDLTASKVRKVAVKVRYKGEMQVDLRCSEGGGFDFVLFQVNQVLIKRLMPGEKTSENLAGALPLPANYDPNQPHEMAVVLQYNLIKFWLDGRFLGGARDDILPDGFVGLMFMPTSVLLSAAMADLDETVTPVPPPVPAALAPSLSPPAIANWQDVTAKLREDAAKLVGAVIDDDSVKLADGSAPQRVIITPAGLKDYAIRVRYTGGTQVDRLSSAGGFLFVICQRTQLAIQFSEKGKVDAEVLAPPVPHPKDYDLNTPHELLITMQGPQVRAWMDGHFVSEARDERTRDGGAGIMIKRYTSIHKVEIAELPADSTQSDAGWVDWLGPKLAGNELDPNVWVKEAGGITTNNPLAGIRMYEESLRDGAVRVTGQLRDSEGVMIGIRETVRQGVTMKYVAQYTGKVLYIAYVDQNDKNTQIAIQEVPADMQRAAGHTLEFKFVGDQLTATLNGTFSVTAKHGELTEGPCSLLINKHGLLTKVEIMRGDGGR